MTETSPLLKEIQYLKGVGPARAAALKKLGVENVYGLLYYPPRAWVDRSVIKPISKLIPGERETVRGIVVMSSTQKVRFKLSITKVVVQDKTGHITAAWYNQPYIEKQFKKGDEVIMHGKIDMYRGMLQINTPEYEISSPDETMQAGVNVNRIVPVYPLTESFTQKQFRAIIKNALDNYLQYAAEYLPEEFRKKFGLIQLQQSLAGIHFPDTFESLEKAKYRLIFDEFFMVQFALNLKKQKAETQKGHVFNITGEYKEIFRKHLPFKLTGAQRRVVEEIKKDVTTGRPMNRLVQGDVGSGKTVVALIAAVIAKDSGFQSAILAPTEILASQHMKTAAKLLEETGIKADLILGGAATKDKKAALERLKTGETDIVIGTHAIIQETVEFKNLGLAVIDEQHRFGVMQRAALLGKSEIKPHVLIMTATPIPRTLAMTVYGDTDVSVIDELPPGRKPVKTVLFSGANRDKLYNFMEERLKEGGQIYMVYPLVDVSEKVDLKSAIESEKETALRFPGYKTAIVHGQMKKEERAAIMADFKEKKIDILAATTVIEVGIDIPNASVMVIEHAERFGLSQLHQLRGRVGRGDRQSYCILAGEPGTEDGFKRLSVMASTSDGFKIAEEDLALRGPGEFLGTRQHGLPEFRLANLITDRKILESARQAAEWLLSANCDMDHIKVSETIDNIKHKSGRNYDLINIG